LTRPLAAALLLPALLLTPSQVGAQIPLPWLSGYYLNVPLWSDASSFGPGGFADSQRLRLMADPSLGPVAFDMAYEQLIAWSASAGGGVGFGVPGAIAPAGGEWLDLQWVIEDDENLRWTHRFDRLNLTAAAGDALAATVGRQTISWATTLLLTPADPFVPFGPADPFREYRGGVDAARLRVFPGPLSEAEIVVRPAAFAFGNALSVLGRYRGVLSTWELSGYAGLLYDDLAFSLAASGGVGAAAVRGEIQLREESGIAVRGTVGIDSRVEALGRDLYLVFEYQHDGFGASSADELEGVVRSAPFARGELQVLSADVTVWQGSYDLHPLLSAQLLVLWSLNDLSALLTPGIRYSLTNEATAQGGIFLGLGNGDARPDDPLPSEFGIVPATVFASLALFF